MLSASVVLFIVHVYGALLNDLVLTPSVCIVCNIKLGDLVLYTVKEESNRSEEYRNWELNGRFWSKDVETWSNIGGDWK